jgi:hypothetical protein
MHLNDQQSYSLGNPMFLVWNVLLSGVVRVASRAAARDKHAPNKHAREDRLRAPRENSDVLLTVQGVQ